ISQRTNLKDGAQVLRSAADGCAVEISIAASHELRSWISALVRRTAKRVKRYHDSQSGTEDSALGVRSTQRSRPVEAPAAALHQPDEWNSTVAKHTSKRVHDRNSAGWGDAKQRSHAEHAASRGRAVKITVTPLHQPGSWVSAVVGKAAERMERC